jgi:hypothetical protein
VVDRFFCFGGSYLSSTEFQAYPQKDDKHSSNNHVLTLRIPEPALEPGWAVAIGTGLRAQFVDPIQVLAIRP